MATNFLAPTPAELEREWGLTLPDEWTTDIVAGDFAPIIRRYGVGEAAQRELVLARFGLQQASAKAVRAPASTVNARTETAATRSADAKKSERWRIRRSDRSPLAIAGLWDRWVGEDGESMLSFSILTLNCDLHPLLSRFNRAANDKGEPQEKRTPVLLAEEDFDAWLDTTPGRAAMYFGTFSKDDLEAEPAPSNPRAATTTMPLDTAISDF